MNSLRIDDVFYDIPLDDWVRPATLENVFVGDPFGNDQPVQNTENAKISFVEDLVGRCTRLMSSFKMSVDDFILKLFDTLSTFFKRIFNKG